MDILLHNFWLFQNRTQKYIRYKCGKFRHAIHFFVDIFFNNTKLIKQYTHLPLRVTYDVLLDNFIAKFFVVVIHTQILLYSTYIGNEQHRLNSIFIHIILVGIPRP